MFLESNTSALIMCTASGKLALLMRGFYFSRTKVHMYMQECWFTDKLNLNNWSNTLAVHPTVEVGGVQVYLYVLGLSSRKTLDDTEWLTALSQCLWSHCSSSSPRCLWPLQVYYSKASCWNNVPAKCHCQIPSSACEQYQSQIQACEPERNWDWEVAPHTQREADGIKQA